MRKNFFLLFTLAIFYLISFVGLTRALTFEELGLTDEDVKYLTPEEKKELLNSIPSANSFSDVPGQDVVPSFVSVPTKAPTMGEGVTSCFDYYTFGSIQADFSASVSQAVAGTPVTFSGTIVNNNKYPIVEGSLVIKIFKSETNREKNINGPDVVDELVVLENISVPANGKIPFKFDWAVPTYAISGEYKASAFFVSSNKFNLLGLSFTDDVIGNSASFSIVGTKNNIQFNKDGVTINGGVHRFAAFPSRIAKNVDANISAEINNTTSEAEKVLVVWKVYAWDSRDNKNLIEESSDLLTVGARGKVFAKLNITDREHPVYYVVAELKYKDSKSIIGVRFVRDGVDGTRINFPAVTSFPIEKGKENTIFSCVHGMGTSAVVPDGKLSLTLKSGDEIIHSFEYKGDILGSMMGIKDTFVPKKSFSNFTLVAKLYRDEKIVDEVEMNYSCKDIDESLCSGSYSFIKLSVIFLIIMIVLIIAIVLLKRKSTPKIIAVLAFGLISVFGSTQYVDAKEVQWNTILGKFAYFWNFSDTDNVAQTDTRRWAAALDTPNITVTYGATITKENGDVVTDGAVLPIGTKIKLNFTPHIPDHIFWFGTGYSGDSPYGEWREGAAPPGISCAPKDFVTRAFYERPRIRISPFTTLPAISAVYDTYVPIVVSPPNKQITNLQNLTCGALVGNTMDCTVSEAGPINPTFNFESTTGKLYYRWKRVSSTYEEAFGGLGCNGNNVPMRSVTGFNKTSTRTYTDGSATITGGVLTEDLTNYVTGVGTSGYVLNVPAKTISFNLTGVDDPNGPPTKPEIVGPVTGVSGQSYSFSFKSTDPDDDELKYGIDWTGSSNTVSQWVPSGGSTYVPDDTNQTVPKSWNTPGSYTFKIKAEDNRGLSSVEWGTHTIVISEGQVAECGTASSFGNIPALSDPTLCASDDEAYGLFFNQSINKYNWFCRDGALNAECFADKTDVPPSTPIFTGSVGTCPATITLNFKSESGTPPARFEVYKSSSVNGTYTRVCNSVNAGVCDDINATVDAEGNLVGSFRENGVVPGQTYYYKVKAINSVGSSALSSARAVNSPLVCDGVVGACGDAIYQSTYVAPNEASDLCKAGEASAVTLKTTGDKFEWTCRAPDGTDLCESDKAFPADALCGSAAGGTYESVPSSSRDDLCNPGSNSAPRISSSDADLIEWTCTSSDRVKTVRCVAEKSTDNPSGPDCGSLDGGMIAPDVEPNPADFCASNSVLINDSLRFNRRSYSWKCGLRTNLSSTESCHADVIVIPPPESCVTKGTCPPVVDGEVELNNLKTFPVLINKYGTCGVDVGLNSGVYKSLAPITKCRVTYPNNTSGPIFDPRTLTGPFDGIEQKEIEQESSFKLTCWEEDVLGVKGPDVVKIGTCKMNPTSVEVSFWQKFKTGVKDVSANVLNAFANLFTLR